MSETIKKLIGEYVDVDINEINNDSDLRSDLGLNSLDLVNLAVAIEEETGINISDRMLATIFTFGELVEYLENQ